MRVALYARLLPDKPKQSEQELRGLHQWCESHDKWQVVEEYLDYEVSGTSDRTEFRRLLSDAECDAFDLIAVSSLSSFCREGARETVSYLNRLIRGGVGFASMREPEFTTVGPQAAVVEAVLTALGEQEHRRLSERVRAGMARARKSGRHVGRPRLAPDVRRQIVQLRNQGMPITAVAKQLGVSVGTVAKYQHRPVDHLLDELLPVK